MQSKDESSGKDISKPPLPHTGSNTTKITLKKYLFANGDRPKNQDVNRFNDDVKGESHADFAKKRRRNINLPSKVDLSYTYGAKNE